MVLKSCLANRRMYETYENDNDADVMGQHDNACLILTPIALTMVVPRRHEAIDASWALQS